MKSKLKLTLSAVILAMAAGALSVWHTRVVSHQREESERLAYRADENLLVMTQQLDEVFSVLLDRLAQNIQVPDVDQQLLKTWLQFDKQFIEKNASNESLRFEVATAHRRLGYGSFLLGEGEKAIEHFHSAVELLQGLAVDHPTIGSYGAETADTYALLGWVLQKSSRYAAAAVAYEDAIRLLNDPAVPADSVRDERLSELHQQLKSLPVKPRG